MKNRIKKSRTEMQFTQGKYNIRYIVVHKTGTKTSEAMRDLEKLPYHYVITKEGKLINLRPLQATEGTIEIALVGGVDKKGSHGDKRTEQQNSTLFSTLVLLSESFPDAKIVGAGELYRYGFANPGFDVRQWLQEYIPEFLLAA